MDRNDVDRNEVDRNDVDRNNLPAQLPAGTQVPELGRRGCYPSPRSPSAVGRGHSAFAPWPQHSGIRLRGLLGDSLIGGRLRRPGLICSIGGRKGRIVVVITVDVDHGDT